MPRFACPRCQTIIDNVVGNLATCSGCGQRLQIPSAEGPPPEVTPVAPVVGQRVAPPAAAAVEETQFRQVLGRMHVFWACPVCRSPVDIPVDMRQQAVRCPHCSERIPVPEIPGHLQPPPPVHVPPARQEEPYSLANDSPPPYVPSRSRRDRDWDPDDRPRRRRRPREDYEDDDDDNFIRRGSGYDLHTCTRAANSGLTCSLISLGLMVVSFVIWAAVASSSPPPNRQGVLVFILFIAVAIAFVLSLLGTIYSSRGMNPINETNRGVATSGLVCGIIGLVISAIVGLFVLCIGLVVFSQLNRF